jgi:hypothetical protein
MGSHLWGAGFVTIERNWDNAVSALSKLIYEGHLIKLETPSHCHYPFPDGEREERQRNWDDEVSVSSKFIDEGHLIGLETPTHWY